MVDFIKNAIVSDDMEAILRSRPNWDGLRNAAVCVTGAAGMIASYFVYFLIYLNERSHANIAIYAVARSPQKLQARFGVYSHRPYFHAIIQDIVEPLSLQRHFDYVVHAASLASPQYYGSNPVETVLPNIIGTYHMLELMRRNPPRSFLFLSTGGVYGNVDGAQSLREDMSGDFDFLNIGNFYGESKRAGEMLCKAYFREYGVPTRCARICHAYGPTMDYEKDSRVFSEFVRNALHGEDIVMKSAGTAKRPFCYLSDAIAGLLKILLDGQCGENYNLANDKEFWSIAEVADIIAHSIPGHVLRVRQQVRKEEGYVAAPERPPVCVNIDKLKNLGWSPTIDAVDGFRRTLVAITAASRARPLVTK